MNKQRADEIITEYLSKLYGFAMKKTFSYDEAEELCANIVCELYSSLLKAAEVFNVEGYVWRISEHVFAKHVSSNKKHRGVSINGLVVPFEENYSAAEAEEELLKLRREITFLTKTRREIVYSYYYENKTIAAIAEETGIPDGTVKWHLSKARNELKEGFVMERKIGKLGMKPIEATSFGHNGNIGTDGGPEFYLKDSLNLNIVYSVYYEPKTKEEIAEELGVTPVFIDERIALLEGNGFLVRQAGKKFTTFVCFSPETYSLEQQENVLKKQLEVAELLAVQYAPDVRKAISTVTNVYIPGENRELLEAAAIFYGIANKCVIEVEKDLSRYHIKTTGGGDYNAYIEICSTRADLDYLPQLNLPPYNSCGSMTRISQKYSLHSWSVDSRYSSREGNWGNNLTSDFEYLYEFITNSISDNSANSNKFNRLRERRYITDDNKVNIMVVQGNAEEFFEKIPALDNEFKRKFADYALESAAMNAKNYPPQMRDLVIATDAGRFISNTAAIMVMDILYGNGTFRELTENERVASNLLMFCDVLPE